MENTRKVIASHDLVSAYLDTHPQVADKYLNRELMYFQILELAENDFGVSIDEITGQPE